MLAALLVASILRFDFPAVQIGTAENEAGPTGVTVFVFNKPVTAVVDVRGGAPGTINTDALRYGYTEVVDAITIAGGSSYGLAAATGVQNALKERFPVANWTNIAGVAGAIIYDLAPRRYSTVTPDDALGRAALANARSGEFPLGSFGAGRFAMNSGYFGDDFRQHSGEGGAFRQIGPTKIAVFTVVNALGAIVDRSGDIVRCSRPPCGKIADRLATRVRSLMPEEPSTAPSHNTTITVVITNQKLPLWALQRLAVQVHASMARAIQPFNTMNDGDTLFAVTTDEADNAKLPLTDLGVIAAEVAWDAVLSSLPELDPRDDRPVVQLDPATLDRAVGEYEFVPSARATLRRERDHLVVTATVGSLYLKANEPVELVPLSATDYRLKNANGDRIRFDANGFVINPGRWPIRATRVK